MIDRAWLVALAGSALLFQVGHPTHAAPAISTAGPPSSAATCLLKGTTEPRADTRIVDEKGRGLARLSGAAIALTLSDFPLDARGRARIETGDGTGSFHIQGFIQASEVPLFAAAPIAVVPGHVWLDVGATLQFAAGARGRLRVEHRNAAAFNQTFAAWAPCRALSISPTPSTPVAAPSTARHYQFKKSSLELFDRPSGTALLQLQRGNDVDAVRFLSIERQRDWLLITHQGDVGFEAWAREKDLAVATGTSHAAHQAPRATPRNSARITLEGEPRTIQTINKAPLRAQPKETDAAIGYIEPGTETYVLEIAAEWASVIPKSLNVVPAPTAQFWVKTSDLGLREHGNE